MRIHSNASGFSSFSGQQSAKERQEAFKRSHRPGELVRAFFVSWETYDSDEGLAWLDINGHSLLAPLAGSYAPGQQLDMHIDAIEPEIVLCPVQPQGENAPKKPRPRGTLHIKI